MFLWAFYIIARVSFERAKISKKYEFEYFFFKQQSNTTKISTQKHNKKTKQLVLVFTFFEVSNNPNNHGEHGAVLREHVSCCGIKILCRVSFCECLYCYKWWEWKGDSDFICVFVYFFIFVVTIYDFKCRKKVEYNIDTK